MQSKLALIATGLLGMLILSGCGVVSHVASSTTVFPSPKTTSSPLPSAAPTPPKVAPSSQANTSLLTPSTESSGASTSTSAFNPVVNQAMTYITGRTNVPLEAPTDIPTPVTALYLGATATDSANAYHVHFQLTTTPLGLNSSSINDAANSGLANYFGGFGGTMYDSASLALKALESGEPASPSALTRVTSVNLGGITGTAWTPETDNGILEWHEGDWVLEVISNSVPDDVPVAQTIVAYLHTHLLPETHGVMIVADAGDGEHTTLNWAEGSSVYEATNYHLAVNAVAMAMAMTSYPATTE